MTDADVYPTEIMPPVVQEEMLPPMAQAAMMLPPPPAAMMNGFSDWGPAESPEYLEMEEPPAAMDYDAESAPPPPDYADDVPSPPEAPPSFVASEPSAPRRPAAAKKTVKARTNFPETWIWTETRTDEDGFVSHSAEVPDTITSWVASALALHSEVGLGVADDRASLEVFKPFFASLNLPYSVKRGEKVGLQVLVFNYDDADTTVDVTLGYNATGANSFDFLDADGNVMATKALDTDPATGDFFDNRNKRRVAVPKGGAATVWFPIRATQVGKTLLHITAIAEGKMDVMKRFLRVEPEGFRVEKTQSELVSLEEGGEGLARTLVLDFPDSRVPGSEFAQLSVIGDTMGPALQNPEGLIKMPYGCGEQNLVNFVPSIVVRRYLEVIERLTEASEKKARSSLESGYQRQLSYMRGDGSFSAFGERDARGSTWLTAFVVKSFSQATPFVYIDRDVVARSCRYLEGRVIRLGRGQDELAGSVQELGAVHNKALMGGDHGGDGRSGQVSMSAYVLIALARCQNSETTERVAEVRGFVERNLEPIRNNSYALSIAAYALAKSNSSRAGEAFTMLDARGVSSGGERSWNYTKTTAPRRPWYWSRPSTLDVEATSYALLTYLERGMAVEAAPIARWLIRQQNPYGGYTSTQDTVMAVQALGAFAEKTYSRDTDLSVTMSADGAAAFPSLRVNQSNAIVLQQQEMKNSGQSGQVQLDMSGKGKAFVSLTYAYHLNPALEDPKAFGCTVRPKASGANRLSLAVSCTYTPLEEGDSDEKVPEKSNMVVVEVEALSGWVFDAEALDGLKASGTAKRTELEKAETKANLYFDLMSALRPTAFVLELEKEFTVAEQKPARLAIFDYYAPEERSELQYTQDANPTLQQACPDCWANIPDIV